MDDGGSESVTHGQGNEAEVRETQTQPARATVGRIQGEYIATWVSVWAVS